MKALKIPKMFSCKFIETGIIVSIVNLKELLKILSSFPILIAFDFSTQSKTQKMNAQKIPETFLIKALETVIIVSIVNLGELLKISSSLL